MSNNRKVLKTATNELGKAKAPSKPIDKPYSQPIVSSEGYKQGPPPSGSHYRIPGNGESTSIYNPTPYPLDLVGPNGTHAQIGPWDTNTQTFNGEPYMDEYPQDEEYHEGDYTEEEIEAFKAGGYVVENISVPELTQAKKGGALLTKKVTCKKCGWKWDAADGGNDLTTCHKCGGQGLIHAQFGRATTSLMVNPYERGMFNTNVNAGAPDQSNFGLGVKRSNMFPQWSKENDVKTDMSAQLQVPYEMNRAPGIKGNVTTAYSPNAGQGNPIDFTTQAQLEAGYSPQYGANMNLMAFPHISGSNVPATRWKDDKYYAGAIRAGVGPQLGMSYGIKNKKVQGTDNVNPGGGGLQYGARGFVEYSPTDWLKLKLEAQGMFDPVTTNVKDNVTTPSINFSPGVNLSATMPLNQLKRKIDKLKPKDQTKIDNDRYTPRIKEGGFIPQAQKGKVVTKSPYQLQEEARKKSGQSKYDMLERNPPQISDNTKVQITNKPVPKVGTPVKTAKEKSDARLKAMFAEENKKRSALNPAIDPQTGDYRSMSAGEADWVWSAPLAGSAGLKAAGAIGSMALPGMSAVPGATIGNAAMATGMANSFYKSPQNVRDWYDVSQGNKDWKEAAAGTAEIAAGLIGPKTGFKSVADDVYQGSKYAGKTLGKKVPQIAKGLIDESYPVFARKLTNKISPLNLVPGYGSKLKGSTVPLGNVLEDVVQGSNVIAPKNKMMTVFNAVTRRSNAPKIISSAKNINKNSSNIFSTKIDPTKPGTNLSFSSTANQTPGKTYREIKQKVFSNYDPNYKLNYNLQNAGKNVSEIPLLDPGASLHRRLPFSNRYVNVDPQKALNNKFQWSTAGTGAQNLAEKYASNALGLGALTAGSIGGAGLYYGINPIESMKQIDPETGSSYGKGVYDDYKKEIDFKNYISKPDPYFLRTTYNTLIKPNLKKKGGAIELDVDDDMINYLISQGYTVEDID